METRKNINGEMLTLEETTIKNKRLIWSVAQRYLTRGKTIGLEPGDLFSIASIGLIKGFNKFDPEQYPVRFSTYAVPMMVGEILRYFRDNSGDLKFSRVVVELANKIVKEEMDDEPTETLMIHFDEDEVIINNALYYLRHKKASSINAVVFNGEGEEITLEDHLGDQKMSDFSTINVNEFLESLSERDRKMIELTMQGLSQKEVAKIVGLNQVQVSRLTRKLYNYTEEFFGYPIGYFQNRPTVIKQKEEQLMKSKIKKQTSRNKKGDLERAKELLATTDMTACKVAKETGINDSSAYYWAKKIREPQVEESPVTVTHIELKPEEVEEKKEVVKAMENMFKGYRAPAEDIQEPTIELNKDGVFIDGNGPYGTGNFVFGVPTPLKLDETKILEAECKAAKEAEEKRQSVLSKAKRSFMYEITSNDVSPSEIHTIFTQVGHAASSSEIDKLNVNVIVTTENLG